MDSENTQKLWRHRPPYRCKEKTPTIKGGGAHNNQVFPPYFIRGMRLGQNWLKKNIYLRLFEHIEGNDVNIQIFLVSRPWSCSEGRGKE